MSAPEVLPPIVGAHGEPIDARVGSLVQWTHPNCQTKGVILKVKPVGYAHIHWFDHEGSGEYPLNHKLLKLISK